MKKQEVSQEILSKAIYEACDEAITGDPVKALEMFNGIMRHHWKKLVNREDKAWFYNGRSNAKRKSNDKRGALADLNRAIRISPFPEAQYFAERAILKFSMGNFKGGNRDFDKCKSLDKELYSYWNEE